MFSIIVPVYNAVAHVERCIDSVLAQNYKCFELIIVNDGSSDGSEVLIRSRYGAFNNVKLIEQGNAGVSVARNVGISHSTGQYLVFLDSDDWLENGYLQYIADLISNSPASIDGVVLSYFLSSFSTKTKFSYHKRRGVIGSDEYCRMFLDGSVSNHPWDKVFKRSLYIDNDIKFPEGVGLGEDAVVSAMLGFYASSIYLSERAYLHYMQDTNGVTTRKLTVEKMIGLDKALSLIVKLYSSRYNARYLSKFYLFKFLSQLTFSSLKLFKKSGAPYENYCKHVNALTVHDFEGFRDCVVKFPIWWFSLLKIPVLSRYYILFLHKLSKLTKLLLIKFRWHCLSEKNKNSI